MLSGTYTVETSDDTRFVVGTSYPLTIDAGVTLDVVETVTVSATAPATTTTPSTANEVASPVAEVPAITTTEPPVVAAATA